MAITRLGGANAISGTLPAANINNTSIGNITALPGAISTGKILQVNQGTTSVEHTTTSTTPADTGLTVDITPASSSNKVLVIASFAMRMHRTSSYYANAMVNLKRGTTNIIARSGGNVQDYGFESNALSSNTLYMTIRMHLHILDSPSTTSATTYKIQTAAFASSTVKSQWNSQPGYITAMEVEA